MKSMGTINVDCMSGLIQKGALPVFRIMSSLVSFI